MIPAVTGVLLFKIGAYFDLGKINTELKLENIRNDF